ncbi:DUF6402 family protein [Luteibacter sp.]|jgi:hypothetical protein|uniref:DUF6402 family protein n=1 Tax=Luteibacter sp. TaxID=1886636 RepID=UPI002F3F8691
MHASLSSSENADAMKERIEAIPRAMYRMGWTVSAALMERWLHSPAWVLPESWKGDGAPDPRYTSPSHLDQRIVRMSWAMMRPRIRIALDRLRLKMANDAAKKVLRSRLTDLNWGTDRKVRFGSRHDSAVQLEMSCQSNFESFGDELDTMDDLYGALGLATLKVALIGEASRDARTGGITADVTFAGFYIRDTYDFNGLQYLGTWTKNGALSKTQMVMNSILDGAVAHMHGEPIGNVFNHDFDAYRRATGYGGDFVIYSDVRWEPVNLRLDLA